MFFYKIINIIFIYSENEKNEIKADQKGKYF